MQKIRGGGVSVVCLAVFSTFHPALVRAQSASTGTVSGQVMDRQSAVIVGAQVTLTDTSTNTVQSTSTNDAGRYIFLNVPPGAYNLHVSKEGFSQARILGHTVEVGLVLTLDLSLDVGYTATSVEVKASAGAELENTNANLGAN